MIISESLREKVKWNTSEQKDHPLLLFVYQSPAKAYGKCFQNAQIWHIVIAREERSDAVRENGK